VTDASKEAEVAAQAAAEDAAIDRRIARGTLWAQWLATLATLGVVVGALTLAWPEIDTSGTLKPDVAGSYLSGVVALLALIWLVAGFYLQRLELEAQRHALRRQANETHDLVEAARLQLEIEIERTSPILSLSFHAGIGFTQSRIQPGNYIRCDVERAPARRLRIDGGSAFELSVDGGEPPTKDLVMPGEFGYYQWPIVKGSQRVGGIATVSYRIGMRRDVSQRFQMMPDHTFRQLADDEEPEHPT
jgi:hypothetical protein